MCVVIAQPELSFLETSALTGENVEEVFLKCTRSILSKIDAGQWFSSAIIIHTHFWLIEEGSVKLLVIKF